MKNRIHLELSLLAGAAVFLASLAATQAGSFVSDFNSGLPGGSSIYGDAAILGSGGFNNSGFLQLTPNAGSKAGSLVITPDLDSGTPVVSFTASFKVEIGGGDRFGYANGMSFNFAPDVPLAADAGAESGVGSGLRVGMRTYKEDTVASPAITVSGGGAAVSGSPAYPSNLRANRFVDMVVQLNPDNTISVVYDGVYLYSNVPLGYTPAAGSLFWIGARTGGSYERHFIDNLDIATRTTAAPFIKTFAPRGRQVPANGALDIVLTDYSTQVDTGSVVLQLDSVTVSPTITTDGAGHTTIHFAPSSPFAASSQHSVSLTFADNASPAPQSQTFSWSFTVGEAVPTDFVTVFSDDFESYAQDALDKNASWSANAAANGSGNPWFGPFPDNYSVVAGQTLIVDSTNVDITPHSGTQMITKSYLDYTCTVWLNVAYRCHGGYPVRGNCRLDWWSFDANDRVNTFKDYVSLYFYNSAAYSPAIPVPHTADWLDGWDASAWMVWGEGFAWGDNDYQSLSLGASGYSQPGGYYKPGKYQARSEEMATGITYGIDGWVNTIERTQGWHHNRILMGPPHADGTVMVYFYIDDMATPVYADLSTIGGHGIDFLEIDSIGTGADPASPMQAYYDDVSFALVQPPSPVATPSGSNVILTWPGEGFTLQKADSMTGTWSDVTGATSGYSYDTTTAPKQFFRLKN